MSKAHLSPAAWIDAGLAQLTSLGQSALRAEPLSRHLRTSKGSFYWHFKDVPAFQAAVLSEWKSRALATLENDAKSKDSTTDKLIRFGQSVQADVAGPALRAWALENSDVRDALAEVDSARTERLVSLLAELDITNDEFASAAYGALVGQQQMNVDDGDALVAYATLIDMVLAVK